MVLAAVAIAACTTQPKMEEYANVIPSDATMLIGMNCQQLGNKSGITADDPLMQRITDSMKEGIDAATVKDLEVILNDPTKSGLDVAAPMYVYTQENATQTLVNFVAKVQNEQALQKLLETLSKEGICTAPQKADGFSFATIQQDAVIAYNGSTMLIRTVDGNMEQVKQEITAQLKQTAEQSIVSTEGFKKLRAMEGDVECLVVYDKFFEQVFKSANIPVEQLSQMPVMQRLMNNYKDAQMMSAICLDDGKISLKYDLTTTNPQTQAFLDENSASLTPLKNKFLKNFPQSSPLLFSFGVDGVKFYDSMMSQIELFPAEAKSYMQTDVTQKICSLFKGDVTFGITDIPMGLPTFLLLAEVTDAAPLNSLVVDIPGVQKEKENEYSYTYMGMFTFYFGIRDNVLYATDDSKLCADLNKAVDSSMEKSSYLAKMKGSHSILAINAETLTASPLIKMAIQQGGQEAALIMTLVNKMSYLTACSEKMSGEGILYMKDTQTNVLKQFVDWGKSLAGM
jgi:hypothetical protein